MEDHTIRFAWTVRPMGDRWAVESESAIPMSPVVFESREDAIAYAEHRRDSANEVIRQFQDHASRP